MPKGKYPHALKPGGITEQLLRLHPGQSLWFEATDRHIQTVLTRSVRPRVGGEWQTKRYRALPTAGLVAVALTKVTRKSD